MRAVVQRILRALVEVEQCAHSSCGAGLLCLIGVAPQDDMFDVEYIVRKCLKARLWTNEASGASWHSSVMDKNLDVMVVSQFTLYGNLKKGNKPDFHGAMSPQSAEQVFEKVVATFRKEYNAERVHTGKFAHYMHLTSVNDGPITIMLDSHNDVHLPRKKNPRKIINLTQPKCAPTSPSKESEETRRRPRGAVCIMPTPGGEVERSPSSL